LGTHRHGYVEAPPDIHTEEARRSDANNVHRPVIEYQLPPQNRSAAKLPLPESVTDHRAGQAAAAAIVLWLENPSLDRLNSEHLKKIAAHPQPFCVASVAA